MGELNRRRTLGLLGAGGTAAVLVSGLLPGVAGATAPRSGPPDAVTATYLRVLLRHTRWAEQQFDASAGIYPARDFTFAVVLGNALLSTPATATTPPSPESTKTHCGRTRSPPSGTSPRRTCSPAAPGVNLSGVPVFR